MELAATQAKDNEAKALSDIAHIKLELRRYDLSIIFLDNDKQLFVVPEEGVDSSKVPMSLSKVYARLGVEKEEAIERVKAFTDKVSALKKNVEFAGHLRDCFVDEAKSLRDMMVEMGREHTSSVVALQNDLSMMRRKKQREHPLTLSS